MDEDELDSRDVFENESGIVEVESGDRLEHILPVHFLPEGKKCYDWVNDNLDEDDATECETTSNEFEASTRQTQPTYSSANIDGSSESDVKRSRLILKAAENGSMEELEKHLSAAPTLVNRTDADGYTALHRATYAGHDSIVEFLISRGANVRAKTNEGWQPIHCAARWNHLSVGLVLLSHCADVNAQTNSAQTALHFAALSSDNRKFLEMLLLRPNIVSDVKNGAGDTPYDLAARNGDHVRLFEMVEDRLKI